MGQARRRQQGQAPGGSATSGKPSSSPRRSLAPAVLLLLAGVAGVAYFLSQREAPEPPGRTITRELAKRSHTPTPADVACGSCHKLAYDLWLGSQHAHANRLTSIDRDKPAFHPERRLEHGSFTNTMRMVDGRFEITTAGRNATTSVYHAEAVIGIEPLRQFLVPFPGGRLQVVDVSYDPHTNDWFNAQGDEDRQPHEWGYWRNRSMTWNVQCAFCHMTGLEKNYDPATDTYHTSWQAMGIGCAQCHTPMPAHTAAPNAPVIAVENPSRPRHIENCGSCHSRREEITGRFKPGDAYHDHFRLALPDLSDVYHPDGQVRDEDFEYTSFLLSRMGHKGITCLDCHNPHSYKNILPVDDNTLCMSCHTPPGRNNAKPIADPVAHGGHKPGSTGNSCVGCHMPITKYMVRDPRRDHGFTCPDPLLTKEIGIPNACTRCHGDKTVDWAIEWADKWYGGKLERRTRERARVFARARKLEDAALPDILRMARDEEIAAWRASFLTILHPWSHRPEVRAFAQDSLGHDHPLVRSCAVRLLSPMADAIPQLRPLQKDPSRLVRVDAAWAIAQHRGGPDPTAYLELRDYLDFTCDQPPGALRQAQLALAEDRAADAESWARKAAAWDPSGAAHNLLARILHALNKPSEAILHFRLAMKLDPTSADHPYALALILAESQNTAELIPLLRKSVQLDPAFGRAWYNLGLALAQRDNLTEAADALRRAESLLADSPDPSYARATLHLRAGDTAAAKDAARKAITIQPGHPGARAILDGNH